MLKRTFIAVVCAVMLACTSSASATCWSHTVWETFHNAVGSTLAKYSTNFTWCGNGRRITSRSASNPWGSVYYLGWSYKGQINYWNTGGTNWGWWTHFTQGSFEYSIPVWGVIQHWYPWIKGTMKANGGFTWTKG